MLKSYLVLLLLVSSCSLFEKKHHEVVWTPDVYIGSSKAGGIVRNNGGKKRFISCKSREFDKYLCLHEDELVKIFGDKVK